jgi:hypothetical protein
MSAPEMGPDWRIGPCPPWGMCQQLFKSARIEGNVQNGVLASFPLEQSLLMLDKIEIGLKSILVVKDSEKKSL